MTKEQIAVKRLSDQAFKERMIVDSMIILSTVEYFQDLIEKRLLDIDALEDNYTIEEEMKVKADVLALLAKLRQEEKRMDEFMAKYKRLIDEKKTLLPPTRKEKSIYLRGIPTNHRREE